MHTNKLNNKKYVGITSKNPNIRWGKNGYNYQTSPYFYNAIQKYGWDEFEHEILFYDLNEKDAKKLEKKYIKKYNSNKKSFGYNMTEGGDGTCGMSFTKEAQIKRGTQKPVVQLDMKGNKIAEYENIHIASNCIDGNFAHISSCCNCRYGRRSHKGFLWMFKSDYNNWDNKLETYYSRFEKSKVPHPKEKLKSIKQENRLNVPINLYDDCGNLLKEYKSFTECVKDIGISHSALYRHCNDKTNIRKNINVRYKEDSFGKFINNGKCKEISQYDKEGNFVRSYKSMLEASAINSYSKSCISSCCREKQFLYKNCFWIYKTQNEQNDINDILQKYSVYQNKLKIGESSSKPISQYSMEGKFIKTFEHNTEAQKIYSKSICSCALGICKSAHGFIWSYKTDMKDLTKEEMIKHKSNYFKPVKQYDLEMKYIAEFQSIKEASDHTGIKDSNINSMLRGRQKTAGGYIWEYVENV